MENCEQKKSLTELTLLDRFLFAEAMENPENMQILLEIILGEEIVLRYLPQTEKEFRKDNLKRIAKVDVWAMDAHGRVFDTEVQKRNVGNLPKRSRYYQGMIDSGLLRPGERDFNKLSPVFIIIIMPFDLFGERKYQYTFTNMCMENREIELNDEAVRIFLNTRGTNDKEVRPELIQLLHYMENPNNVYNMLETSRMKQLHSNITELQNNKEVGVRYMQYWEELAEMRDEGVAKGMADSVLTLLEEIGTVDVNLTQRIRGENDMTVLGGWLKYAARATSISQFVEDTRIVM